MNTKRATITFQSHFNMYNKHVKILKHLQKGASNNLETFKLSMLKRLGADCNARPTLYRDGFSAVIKDIFLGGHRLQNS